MCDSMQGIHKSMQDDVGSRASENSHPRCKHLTFMEFVFSIIKHPQPRELDAAVVCHCIYRRNPSRRHLYFEPVNPSQPCGTRLAPALVLVETPQDLLGLFVFLLYILNR